MRLLTTWVAAVAFLLSLANAHAQDTLNGRYFGIDDATGASIVIRPDPGGFKGTFYDPQGNSQDFEADADGDVAVTALDMDGRTVLMRIAPLPYGAQVSIVPFTSEGKLDIEASRSLGFLREGIQLPRMPSDGMASPRSDCTRVAAYGFMVSYEFWPPAGVMNGFNCLPERARTLMRFFPGVKVDVVWKICLAPDNRAALARALHQTGLTCENVVDAVADIQRRDRFNRYKQAVAAEREVLTMVMRCAEGYPETKANCERASRQLKDYAISLRTPRDWLAQFR